MATEQGRPEEGALPDRVVEDLLSSERRQHMLACLSENEGEMVVADLAAAVSARERDTDPSSVGRARSREVRDDIYERHLPKLTATGVVDFDSMLGAVRLADRQVGERARK